MALSISLKVKFAGHVVGKLFGAAGNDLADGYSLTTLTATDSGNTYYAFAVPIKKRGGALGRPYAGIPVPAFADVLPETATLVVSDGKRTNEVTLVLRETKSNGGTGSPQRRHDKAIEVPFVGSKMVQVYVTNLGDGVFNIDACVRGVSGGGGKKTASAATVKALF